MGTRVFGTRVSCGLLAALGCVVAGCTTSPSVYSVRLDDPVMSDDSVETHWRTITQKGCSRNLSTVLEGQDLELCPIGFYPLLKTHAQVTITPTVHAATSECAGVNKAYADVRNDFAAMSDAAQAILRNPPPDAALNSRADGLRRQYRAAKRMLEEMNTEALRQCAEKVDIAVSAEEVEREQYELVVPARMWGGTDVTVANQGGRLTSVTLKTSDSAVAPVFEALGGVARAVALARPPPSSLFTNYSARFFGREPPGDDARDWLEYLAGFPPPPVQLYSRQEPLSVRVDPYDIDTRARANAQLSDAGLCVEIEFDGVDSDVAPRAPTPPYGPGVFYSPRRRGHVNVWRRQSSSVDCDVPSTPEEQAAALAASQPLTFAGIENPQLVRLLRTGGIERTVKVTFGPDGLPTQSMDNRPAPAAAIFTGIAGGISGLSSAITGSFKDRNDAINAEAGLINAQATLINAQVAAEDARKKAEDADEEDEGDTTAQTQ